MFAVPGWAVSADLLVATNSPNDTSGRSRPEISSQSSRNNSKKRKQGESTTFRGSQVTSEDLHKLWNKEFARGENVNAGLPKKKQKKLLREKKFAPPSNEEQGRPVQTPTNGVEHKKKNTSRSKEVPKKELQERGEKQAKQKQKAASRTLKSKNGTVHAKTSNTADPQPNLEYETVDGSPCSGMPQKTVPENAVQQALEILQELPPPSAANLTPLQAQMRNKLTAARFRHLNETLYTSPSSTALDLFTSSPDLFAEYHAGFAQQVRDSWPENPVDEYVREIESRAKIELNQGNHAPTAAVLPLPRRKTGSCTIADLGCGDASLARSLHSRAKHLHLVFHSFDLHRPNSLVTKADIADLPLRDGEADIAILCLSLMGTNWITFIEEAWRVLRGDGKGELWIAEVKSRFRGALTGSSGNINPGKKKKLGPMPKNDLRSGADDRDLLGESEGDMARKETDVTAFVNVVQRRGFALQPESVKKHNKMFVSMVFHKTGVASAGKYQGLKWNGREYEKGGSQGKARKKFVDEKTRGEANIAPEQEAKVLKPCVYKKR